MNTGVLTKGLMYITLPSILATMWNLDDEDRKKKYLEIPQWKKNSAWCIVLGEDVFTMPKPHAAGVAMGSLMERFIDHLYANDRKAFKGFSDAFFNSVTPDITPLALSLPFELHSNWSKFGQRPIVPASEQHYSPLEQCGPYTSDTARWLSKVLYDGTNPFLNMIGKSGIQVSPRKVEYLATNLGGNLVKDVMKVADMGIRALEGKEMPDSKWYDKNALSGRFLTDTKRHRRSEQDFRDGLDDITKDLNSALLNVKVVSKSSLTPRERALVGSKNNIENLRTKELKAISALQKEIKDITKDPRMSGARKKQLIDTRGAKVNNIARQALKKLQRIEDKAN